MTDQKHTKIRTLIVNPQPVTRQHIKSLKERAGSWNKLAAKLGYKSKSTVISAYAHPERITPKLAQRIRDYEMELEADKGHWFEITNLLKHVLPKRFRIAEEPKRCLGHNEPTFGLPKSGYCSEECKELYQAKKKRR